MCELRQLSSLCRPLGFVLCYVGLLQAYNLGQQLLSSSNIWQDDACPPDGEQDGPAHRDEDQHPVVVNKQTIFTRLRVCDGADAGQKSLGVPTLKPETPDL